MSFGCAPAPRPSTGVLASSSSAPRRAVDTARVATCGPKVPIDSFDVCLDPTPRDFLDAERNCRALGGGLFEITSQPRALGVALAFGIGESAPTVWIGVFRSSEGAWQIAHTGQPPSIEQWAEGEPNDVGGEEDCVEVLRNGRWNDAHCAVEKPFLCEPADVQRAPFACMGTAKLVDGGLACLHTEGQRVLHAVAGCEAAGGRLLTVDSFEEGERLAELLATRSGDVWFGLSDLAEEGTWRTQADVKAQFNAWRNNEPNDVGDRGEDCATVGLHDAAWNDVPCDVKARSLCGIPADR